MRTIVFGDRQRLQARGFTLVELLVVIGIIAVLIAILLPALSKARESSKQLVCLSNIRQLAMAGMMYAGEHKGILPRASNERVMLPYEWREKTFVDLIRPYLGMDVTKLMSCPSVDPELIPVRYYGGGGPNPYYESHYNWLPGLAEQDDPATNPLYPARGYFLETPATAVKLRLAGQPASRRMICDINLYLYRNGGEGRANHGNWTLGRPISDFLKGIRGSNCVYADGHGEWVPRDRMGKGDRRPQSQYDARYTHAGTAVSPSRPYFW